MNCSWADILFSTWSLITTSKHIKTQQDTLFVIVYVIPQFDWLCDVCGCVMSPTSGIYWVDLIFINNYKEPQLWLVILRYSIRDGNGAGRGRRMGSSPPPRMDFSCPHPRPAPYDGENFLPHPRPLRPREDPRSPALHCKTLFLVNFPYNYYHFFK